MTSAGTVFNTSIDSRNVKAGNSSDGTGAFVLRFALFAPQASQTASVAFADARSMDFVINATTGNRIRIAAKRPFVLQLLLEMAENGADLNKMPAAEQLDCFVHIILVDLLDSNNTPMRLLPDWFRSDSTTKLAHVNGKWMARLSGQSKSITSTISFSAAIIRFYFLSGAQQRARRETAVVGSTTLELQPVGGLLVNYPSVGR